MSNLIRSLELCVATDEKKIPKKPKIPKLPNKLIVIKNVEKDGGWMETWDKPRNRKPGHLIHPFKLLALGGTGKGKSNSLKHIFLQHQGNRKPFKKLYIITCSEESSEWLDTEPTEQFTEIPDLDMFDGEDKTCVIIDDFETAKITKEQFRKLATLMRYICTHRNVSCMLSYQSFFDTPTICRKVANCFMVYKATGRQEQDTIANRLGIDKKKMRRLFKEEITGQYDHLFVDKTVGTPYPLRRNIYEVLDENSDSESE
jgi:hypothetical protein